MFKSRLPPADREYRQLQKSTDQGDMSHTHGGDVSTANEMAETTVLSSSFQ
jgi:hypothetical protein